MYLVNDLGHHPDDVAYIVPYLRSHFSAKFHPRFNKRGGCLKFVIYPSYSHNHFQKLSTSLLY